MLKTIGIISISCLTAYALYLGHNGVMFSAVIAVIAGMSGYEIGVKKKRG